MITFHTLKYKNFLSAGNNFVTISLDKDSSTLIVGKNGSGKSSIIDALSFALYGKSFRGANKPLLINSVNGKECVVEVEFSTPNAKYKVVRGISPVIFEIYKDGVLYNQDAKSKDYQKHLEQNILKLSFKSFSQVVVLGSASYVPFMKLTAADRREIIEDLLDIHIFSEMNSVLKERIATLKQEMKDLDSKLSVVEEKIQLQKDHIKDLEAKDQKIISDKKNKIEMYQGEIDALMNDITELQKISATIQEKIKNGDDIEKNISLIESARKQISQKTSALLETIEFYEKNDLCPTCSQSIGQELKNDKIENNRTLISTMKSKEPELQVNYEKLLSKLNIIRKYEAEIYEIQKDITNKNFMVTSCQKHIKDLQNEISKISQESFDEKAEDQRLNRFETEKSSVLKAVESSKVDMHYYKVAEILLKDSNGIKARIIEQYLPIMNRLINRYLVALDFFINFHLDENFKETVRSKHRDDFSYESFSEGQKFRINIAILLAWRDIAKLKNSISTNVLILDEVFDSSLDNTGIDDFMNLMKAITKSDKNTNIFVISHRGQNMIDKFDNVLEFSMSKGFTVMEDHSEVKTEKKSNEK